MFIKVLIIDLKYEWKTCFFSYVNKSKTLSISHMTSSMMIIFRIIAYKPFFFQIQIKHYAKYTHYITLTTVQHIRINEGRYQWNKDRNGNTWPTLLYSQLRRDPLLCDPVDHGPPGSSVHGVLWATTLEWVAMLSSRESSWPRDKTHISYVSCFSSQVLYH